MILQTSPEPDPTDTVGKDPLPSQQLKFVRTQELDEHLIQCRFELWGALLHVAAELNDFRPWLQCLMTLRAGA